MVSNNYRMHETKWTFDMPTSLWKLNTNWFYNNNNSDLRTMNVPFLLQGCGPIERTFPINSICPTLSTGIDTTQIHLHVNGWYGHNTYAIDTPEQSIEHYDIWWYSPQRYLPALICRVASIKVIVFETRDIPRDNAHILLPNTDWYPAVQTHGGTRVRLYWLSINTGSGLEPLISVSYIYLRVFFFIFETVNDLVYQTSRFIYMS